MCSFFKGVYRRTDEPYAQVHALGSLRAWDYWYPVTTLSAHHVTFDLPWRSLLFKSGCKPTSVIIRHSPSVRQRTDKRWLVHKKTATFASTLQPISNERDIITSKSRMHHLVLLNAALHTFASASTRVCHPHERLVLGMLPSAVKAICSSGTGMKQGSELCACRAVRGLRSCTGTNINGSYLQFAAIDLPILFADHLATACLFWVPPGWRPGAWRIMAAQLLLVPCAATA